jgi:hypothetical protein
MNLGQHSHTAFVKCPIKEKKAILNWGMADATALNDIVLLLSLLTGRNIFFVDDDKNLEHFSTYADSRHAYWGGSIGVSIPYEKKIVTDIYDAYNIGFEKGINSIYNLIRSYEWQKEYQGGYFLFLTKQAFISHTLETAFINCWTILEHLFSVHNRTWLSSKDIQKFPAKDKLKFLFVKYSVWPEFDSKADKKMENLIKARNRLIHYGKFPHKDFENEFANLLIRITEYIVAKILGLKPSNVFNVKERVKEYFSVDKKNLSKQKKKQVKKDVEIN